MRRGNGEGSLSYNKKRMRYEYRVFTEDPVSHRQVRKMFTSKQSGADARKKAKQYIEALRINANKTAVLNLESLLNRYLDNTKNAVKEKTWERYNSLVNNNIRPYPLYKALITAIDTDTLQRHFTLLKTHGGSEKQGLAPRSVNSTRRLLIAAYEYGILNGLAETNPAQYTRTVKVDPPDWLTLTPEKGKKLVKAALKRSRYAWAVIVLALGTGMRIGEIFGLEWENVNLEAKTLTVKKTVVTTRRGTLVQDSAKTKGSRRTILLPDYVVYMLKRFLLWQKVASIRLGKPFPSSPWVFANQKGLPRSPSSFSGHDFKELLDQVGISRKFRVHDMRHTHATWLIDAGVNIKVISDRLGHSSIRVTLDTYAHVSHEMQETAVKSLNSIM